MEKNALMGTSMPLVIWKTDAETIISPSKNSDMETKLKKVGTASHKGLMLVGSSYTVDFLCPEFVTPFQKHR